MKEEAYELLKYLAEHTINGSTTALIINNKIPILLEKESNYEISITTCINGEAIKISKKFTKNTIHKAIYELIDDLSELTSQDVEELKIIQKVSFDECLPRRRQESIVQKKKKDIISMEEYKKLIIGKQIHVYPLLQISSKQYLSLILDLGIVDLLELASPNPMIIQENQQSPYKIKDLRTIYTYISFFKLDQNNKTNPLSTVIINNSKLTIFTMIYSLEDVYKEVIELNFLDNKKIKLNKYKVKTISLSSKGYVNVTETDILGAPMKGIRKNDVRIGLFMEYNGNFIQINDIKIGDLHERGDFTFNEYIYASLYVIGIDSYEFFDNVIMKFVNTFIARNPYLSKLTKDIIEREANINYSIPFVSSSSGNKVSLLDPIAYWYSRDILGNEDYANTPISQHSQKLNELLIAYRKNGYFRNIFI
ncbi:hypothetical protein BFU36_03400 [Sulfolobus sp. A20]|uniref:hypothetical protein n=1 Tax=Sulfolobaceae TaxID=118883 RepID=UPI0008462709|nr:MULTISPECIES: hypothetical protein [unclassified Sulfolobus]TRM78548.1 hypothetical protein DJ532_00740 [Sulfolobus sp. A20-N-F8]TRM82086.1 hypothetical protein DJ524_01855 [Sulfolobus sp. D5]TRM89820.1 hypothetical protein DJ529_00060 [Sulfolobus sp. C3]TRM95338.1 hypothetical protein DJ526_00335 [Sulfolobus sp. A20-N-G8]TRM98274.1 hypothetical protein DJ530_11225 [Sulfolobus sp. E1]TRN00706.1 hypothetical protein DJ527_06835 [Sulfolobus sp. F1]